MPFADTNVLLYAVSHAPAERPKAERAVELLSDRTVALSVQVLQEFYVQATRPSAPSPYSHEEACELLETFLAYRITPLTVAIVRAATTTRARFQISYWDAAIIEAARSLQCDVVLSEDLGDGTDYAGVRVENPFRGL